MESAYAATLPPRERRLAGRLEGFGDIVFGFAVSQCAIQLPTVHGHVDLARGLSLIAYFATFAVLARLWLSFHQILSESFRPTGIDLLLAFGYLAFVTLMPYAMYSISHQRESLAAARAAVGTYTILFGALLFLGATLALRNLRRGWYYLDAGERNFSWRAFVRRTTFGTMMLLACAVDVVVGPAWSTIPFLAMIVVARLTYLLRLPSPARLRIPAPIGMSTA